MDSADVLPVEVVAVIVDCLPDGDKWTCRLVSKTFRGAIIKPITRCAAIMSYLRCNNHTTVVNACDVDYLPLSDNAETICKYANTISMNALYPFTTPDMRRKMMREMHIANNMEVSKYMLETTQGSIYKRNHLKCAIILGNLPLVKYIIDRFDFTMIDALSLAAKHRKREIVSFLLDGKSTHISHSYLVTSNIMAMGDVPLLQKYETVTCAKLGHWCHALESGSQEMYEYCVNKVGKHRCSDHCLKSAVKSGSMDMIRIVHSHTPLNDYGYTDFVDIASGAMAAYNPDVIENIRQTTTITKSYLLDAAIEHDVVCFVREEIGPTFTIRMLDLAMINGSVEVLEWLKSTGYSFDAYLAQSPCGSYARYCCKTADWLRQNGYNIIGCDRCIACPEKMRYDNKNVLWREVEL